MEQQLCCNCFLPNEAGAKFCEHCGHSTVQDWDACPHALPYGTVLAGRYITGRILGRGGFGITYVAQDFQTKQRVAIKEFFPDAVASRGKGNSIVPYTGQSTDDFQYGKKAFLEEAKTLAQFVNEPGVVHIHSYFEEFGTAYFAMELVDGISLQKYIEQSGGRITWDEAKRILLPVMDAMSKVHARGIIHRDIKPDNIYLSKAGSVKILDFGSARYSMGEKSRSLDVVLTHGFAPKEQYSRHGRQGAYTDVYALAATFYYAVTGRKPQDSIDRMDNDSLAMPSSLGARIPEGEEEVLLKALSVEPQDRFPTMEAFRQALLAGSVAAGMNAVPPVQQGYQQPVQQGYQQPVQQGYQQPVQQGYQAPAQQNYTQPVQQGYQPPAQQNYTQPVQQGYQPPAQQGYTQPVQQGYQQPPQQGYTQPVQQGYQPPAQQGYAQPVQPGYQPPAQELPQQPAKKKKGWLLPLLIGLGILVVGGIVALIVVLTSNKGQTVNPTETIDIQPTEPTVIQTMPTQPTTQPTTEAVSDYAGYYIIKTMSYQGTSLTREEMEDAGIDPDSIYLILREDGTGEMGFVDDSAELTWSSDGTCVIDGDTAYLTLVGDELTLNAENDGEPMTLVFTRSGSAPLPGQSSDGLSGTCGDDAAWVFDPDSGTLTISGTGAIYDYSDTDDIPWYPHRDDIDKLEIEEGITRIGKGAFYECAEWNVSLPKTVTSIGELSFAFSQVLYTANIPSSVTSIERGAFYGCALTENIYVHSDKVAIGENAFASCEALRFLLFYGDVTSIGDNAFYGDTMAIYTPDTSAWSTLADKDYGGIPHWFVGGADGTIYKADKYDVFLPKSWDKVCTVEVDGDQINVYHTASKNAGMGGFLFGLNIYSSASEYDYFPSYIKIGTLKKSGTVYDLVAVFPTDLQTNSANQDEYLNLSNEAEAVLKSVYGRNSYNLWFE